MIIGVDASRAFGTERTGTENYSYHLITQMLRLPAAREHQFVLFVRPKTIIPEEIVLSRAKIVEISLPILWTQVGLALNTWRKPKLDVLWIPAHTLPILRRPNLKTVVTIHGLEYEWLPQYENWLQRWYLPLSTIYAVRSANKLIAVSHFTKNQLVKRLKANSKDIKVIHEGVSVELQVSSLSSSKLGDLPHQKVLNKYKLKNKGYILFVGTIQPRKNLIFLIEAYAQLPLPLRKQYKLVIAGSPGFRSEEVYAAPARVGVRDQVFFSGRVSEEELNYLYYGAVLYAQPSITEGFGLPVLEAMARGVPVVVSNGGALPEVVGEAGLVLPLVSVEWVRVMTQVLNSPRRRERLSAAGKWRAKSMSWEKAASMTLDFLKSI